MRLGSGLWLLVLFLAAAAAEDFEIPDPPEDGTPNPNQKWPPDKPSAWPQHKPRARAGVLVARYVPQSKMPPGVVVPFANITYRIVGADMNMPHVLSKYDAFELSFKKLYGAANLHAKFIHVRSAEPANGTVERPCRGDFDSCCLSKAPVADPETWSAIDVTLEVGCSRESLWPDQGSVDWAHSRMLGTHLHSIGFSGRLDWAHSRIIGTLLSQHGFDDVRCLLQRADVLPEGVHAHKYLPITALYTEETTVQFTGNSLSQWLPMDIATQNLILHSMDLIGLNRIAGCARIRISRVSQQCNWEPGRGQIGIANVTFVTHREYPETTLPMAFGKTFHMLLERLNEEGLNLAEIEVVENAPVKGPEWGNMHDQIESMLAEDDPVRTYETRVPVTELPNFKRPRQPLSWGLVAACATTGAAVTVGAVLFLRQRQPCSGARAVRARTAPLSSVGRPEADECPEDDFGGGGRVNPFRASEQARVADERAAAFKRRESAPAAQGMREMWERAKPHFPPAVSAMPGSQAASGALAGAGQSPMQALLDQGSMEDQRDPTAFNTFLDRMRTSREEPGSGQGQGQGQGSAADLPEISSTDSRLGLLSPWSASTDSPNPFLADAELGSGEASGSSRRPGNFGTVPAATVIQQGSLHDSATEQQRQEQLLKSQKLKERGAMFEQQLHRADSVASWLLSDGEIEICLREDGKRWLLGAGAYGKVYRGVRGGVQDVAVKVLHTTDDVQINQFCLEIKLLKSLSFDRNIVQFLGVCLHSGNPMLVLEFMEGGDLRQALSSPEAPERYHWNHLGQHVALDVVRGLHFLHRNKVVHSDLKSRNVLLGRDGITAKLSDVGMSRILSGSRSAPVPGDVPGTFPYAAPELLLGQSCTVKADIFSLGVLFWEICTREIPVRGMLRPLRVPEECSQEVAQLIEVCMHFDPDLRPHARGIFDQIRTSTSAQVARQHSLASSGELSARLGESSHLRQQHSSSRAWATPPAGGDSG